MSDGAGQAGIPSLQWLRVAVRSDWRVLAAAFVCGIAFDWAVQVGVNSLVGTVSFVVLPLAILLSGRLQSRTSRIAIAVIPLFGMWMAIRTSPALLVPNFLCVLALCGIAGMWSRSGSVFRISLFDLLARVFAFGVQALFVPEFILRALPHIRSERLRRFRPVISGLFLALPLVLVLGLLLISADSVFASVFSVSIDVGGLPLHVFLFVVGAWFASTVMRAASCSYDGVHGSRAIMGFTESIVVVGAMVVLYAAFVATQIVVWAGGAQHVLQTSGLTYAEHARRGFFQLVVVGAITLVVLTTLRGTAAQAADRQVRIWQGISLLAVLLTLVIVGVAIQRLFLYEDAYGLTMLRLYATLFAFWIGVVFVLYAVTLFLRTDNRWFFGASVAFGMASLLAMNVVNPEALVVHRNIDRANTAVVPLDMDYLGTLSDDGLAAIVSSFDGLDATQQQAFVTSVCSGFDSGSDHSGFSYNRSRAQVASFRTGHCTQ